jgi:glycosyltransferase involved in cell wall biosynthesis
LISFCIISRQGEIEKLDLCKAHIEVNARGSEIITVFDESGTGKLGKLRNQAIQQATGDIIVSIDNDILIHHDFVHGLKEFAYYHPDWLVCSCRLLNVDGSRHWDWKEHTNADRLLDYSKTSRNIVLTGGLVIARRELYERVTWDERLGFYQKEDIDFSNRIKAQGIEILFNPYSTATHNDDRYYHNPGKGVLRKW